MKASIGKCAGELKDKGYILLKNILFDEFLNYLKDFHKKSLAGDIAEIGTWRIAGKKQQYVFPFPSDRASREFRDALSRLTGLKIDTLTISERHLKQYETDAKPYPAPTRTATLRNSPSGCRFILDPRPASAFFLLLTVPTILPTPPSS